MNVQTTTEKNGSLLDKALRADGAFALASGAVSIFAARPVAELIELAAPVALVALGAVLLGYGGMLLFAAGRQATARNAARAAVILNLLWVAGSYAGLLLGAFPVNTAGKWAIALIAEAVFFFALLEAIALRRLSRA